MAGIPPVTPEERREAVAQALEDLARTVRSETDYPDVGARFTKDNDWHDGMWRFGQGPDIVKFRAEIELRKPREGWPW